MFPVALLQNERLGTRLLGCCMCRDWSEGRHRNGCPPTPLQLNAETGPWENAGALPYRYFTHGESQGRRGDFNS